MTATWVTGWGGLTAQVRRHHKVYRSTGHVWQGRIKAFPIQEDDHLLSVLRYIERNPSRPGLVARAEDWPWSSLHWWQEPPLMPVVDRGPVPHGEDWVAHVNQVQTEAELEAGRRWSRTGGCRSEKRGGWNLDFIEHQQPPGPEDS